MFADPSVPAVATYEPFMSQAVKNLPDRKAPDPLSRRRTIPASSSTSSRRGSDDLKANPEKYRKFLRGIYKAVDYYKSNPAEFIKLAAPHFNLTEAEVKDILDTSLVYTDYEESARLSSARPASRGKLYEIFDTVMQLNLENGAADTKLDAAKQIDTSVIQDLF